MTGSNNSRKFDLLGQTPTNLADNAIDMLDGLSYEDYFKKLDEMVENMRQFWKNGRRVKALKVLIQLAKLLSESNGQLKLYSKRYRVITKALEEFGQLVHLRIQSISLGEKMDSNLWQATSDGIIVDRNEQAIETCKNWFLKVASIRELAPRFYVELAILKIVQTPLNMPGQRFTELTDAQFYGQSLKRLTKVAWGFGSPMVALHSRAYLCKVADHLIHHQDSMIINELVLMNSIDGATAISALDQLEWQRHIKADQTAGSKVTYFELTSNALQSIINVIVLRLELLADQTIPSTERDNLELMFDSFIQKSKLTDCSIVGRNIILHSALRTMPASLIADRVQELLNLFEIAFKQWESFVGRNRNEPGSDITDQMIIHSITPTFYQTLESFAIALQGNNTFESNSEYEHLKVAILDSLDSILDNLFNYDLNNECSMQPSYLHCCKAWFCFASNHHIECSKLDAILFRFLARIKKHYQHVSYHSILLDLIKSLVSSDGSKLEEFGQMFKLKSFFPLIELLNKDDHRFEAAKWCLETMRASLRGMDSTCEPKKFSITNPLTISSLLRLFSIVNESLNLLSEPDDLRHLSLLIIYFIQTAAFQTFADHLNFYSNCRSSMSNLNYILDYLALQALDLPGKYVKVTAGKRGSVVKKNHLNSCLAFTFVTIPAINRPVSRLNLLTRGTKLSLDHMSLSLADYFIKHAIANLLDTIKPEIISEDSNVVLARDNLDAKPPDRKEITQCSLELLNLIIDHQDHINLRHRLALNQLIELNFNDNEELMKRSKLLNIIEDDDEI